MSFPTGGSGFGAPAPQPAPPASSKGLPFLLSAATAGLGVLNFLLGFTPFAKIDGIERFSGADSSQNFFQAGYPVTPLAFLLLAGLLAGLGLLVKGESKTVAAATSVVGFLVLVVLVIALPEGLSLDWGSWVVLFFAFVQAVTSVGALLFDQGLVKAPAPKPAGVGGFGQGAPGFGQTGPGYGQQYPQGYGPQPGYPAQGQGAYGQPPTYGGPGPQSYGAQGQQQPYGAPTPQYGRPQQQQPPQGYSGYGSVPAQPSPQSDPPAPQYQPPVQGATGPTYGSSLDFGSTPNPSQHSAPESDPTQAFRAPTADDDK